MGNFYCLQFRMLQIQLLLLLLLLLLLCLRVLTYLKGPGRNMLGHVSHIFQESSFKLWSHTYCEGSREGKSRLADSEVGLELDTLEFDASSW
jgi:hypothetical protein